jgi:signal transduction histidine kinase/DNA-binding NarL/FixJ family response regulator
VSTLLITQEALTADVALSLSESLRRQPEWSDLPVIVLTSAGASDAPGANQVRDLLPSGNVTLLERPLRIATLVSAVRMALRARDRQHQLAGYLAERARASERLRETVAEVTAERDRANQAVRLSERMASLGTFAAGLGHDLSNLLLPLRTRVDLLLHHPDLPQDAREDIEAIARPADYLAQLTRGLRHFTQDPEQGWESPYTDVTVWRREVEGLVRTIVPGGITLTIADCSGLPAVAVPVHALTQATFNLVHNARDAVLSQRGERGGGEITLSCAVEGSEMRLCVRDNGCGMTDEVRERCTEPFFTTKARQRGTGLGLAMVHGIAQRCGGAIQIESTLGEGTAITLRLPIAAHKPATRGPRTPRPRASAGRDVRLLCVDDNALVLASLARMAAIAGDIRVVGTLARADSLVSAAEELKPDVVLLDLEMPGLDTMEAIRLVRGKVPRARVVVLTGTINPGAVTRALRAGAAGFVTKADAESEILDAVREAARGRTALSTEAKRMAELDSRATRRGADQAETSRRLTTSSAPPATTSS